MHKEYLGDSVYATYDDENGSIVLTTENGYTPANAIVMEPNVIAALQAFLLHVKSLHNKV